MRKRVAEDPCGRFVFVLICGGGFVIRSGSAIDPDLDLPGCVSVGRQRSTYCPEVCIG